VLNPKNLPDGVSESVVDLDFAISPLFHIHTGTVELVLGPTLGFWIESDNTSTNGFSNQSSFSGTLYGINTGIFFPVGARVSLGGMLSFVVKSTTQECDGSGNSNCFDPNFATDKVFGGTFGVLF